MGFFVEARDLREDMRKDLRQFPDIERALSRLALGRGGPRDLAALSAGLRTSESLNDRLRQPHGLAALSAELKQAEAVLADRPAALLADLTAVLGQLPAAHCARRRLRAGGHSAELDQHRGLRDETRQVIAELQSAMRRRPAIKSLKVRHNNVLGYFIEVTAQNAAPLQKAPLMPRVLPSPDDRRCGAVHDRGTVDARTADRRSRRVGRLPSSSRSSSALRLAVKAEAQRILRHRGGAGHVDVAAALAELAERRRYVRPHVDRSLRLDIRQGRHPVVEAMLAQKAEDAFRRQ